MPDSGASSTAQAAAGPMAAPTMLAQAGPVWLSMLVLGLGFGILVVEAGLPIWAAPAISGIVFAGSVEFLLIGMITAAAPLSAIALTTAFTNSRHIAYGLSYPNELIRGRGKGFRRFFAVYSLCDETYALTMSLPKAARNQRRMLLTALGNYLGWIGGSTLGAIVGSQWVQGIPGIDFVMTGLFLVLAIDTWKNTTDQRIRIAALGTTALAAVFMPEHLIVASLTLFSVLALANHYLAQRGPIKQSQPE